MTQTHRFQEAVSRIDAANAADPRHTIVAGVSLPHELHYAKRMTRWLDRLEPAASEALRLAVRCQHLCRWEIPRADFPMTRAGYHQWRMTLGRFHADKAAEILKAVGYDEETAGRVQALVRKEGLKTDPETQTLEDVACLVFLEDELADFAARHDEAKVVAILRKTWGKMSPRGREVAVTLDLPPAARWLLTRALAAPPAAPEGPAPAPTTPP